MNCNAHNLSSRNQGNKFEQFRDKQLKLQLSANNFVTARLENNKKFNVLVDSGSSKLLLIVQATLITVKELLLSRFFSRWETEVP